MISGSGCWKLPSSKKQPCLRWWRVSTTIARPSIFRSRFACSYSGISKRTQNQKPSAARGARESCDTAARKSDRAPNSGRSKDHDCNDRHDGQQAKHECCLLPSAIVTRIVIVKVAECRHRIAPCVRVLEVQGKPPRVGTPHRCRSQRAL